MNGVNKIDNIDKKIFGTTIFIGSVDIDTLYGKADCYVFQDVIDHKYVFALCKNLSQDVLYTRVHSSCLTSETIQSLDCDCKDQLYGAVKKIVEDGGIMFYLMQSGRGASLISKTRGCQMVQYMKDTITTFDAYDSLGLKHDYRDYRNIKDILIIMNLMHKEFILLTNNPTKIEKIGDLGIRIKDTQAHQFPANPFNKKYLLSKQESGHTLEYSQSEKFYSEQPSVEPFEPYHIPTANRFIHCSSYYVPVRNVKNRIIINRSELKDYDGMYTHVEILKGDRLFVRLSNDYESHLVPYWFKANIYYDIATHSEYIVLEYGDTEKTPVVRFHSEFILNRFPISDTKYKNRYTKSVVNCVRNGSGIIIIANHNGDNCSIGRYILQHNKSDPTGIDIKRDYDSIIKLLVHHTKNIPIKMLYSQQSKSATEEALEENKIRVCDWICIDEDDKKGHELLQKRMRRAIHYLETVDTEPIDMSSVKRIWVSGIGSSESHAKYFIHVALKKRYNVFYYDRTTSMNNINDNDSFIVITQGMSPHGLKPLLDIMNKRKTYENIILFTSVTKNNKNLAKVDILNRLTDKGGVLINFPEEDEYDVLVRVIGPMCCFYTIYNMLTFDIIDSFSLIDKLINTDSINYEYVSSIIDSDNLIILVPDEIKSFCGNIYNKMIEGCFLSTCLIVSFSEFAHGYFQYCMNINRDKKVNIILLDCKEDNLIRLTAEHFNTLNIDLKLNGDLNILEIEHIFNDIMLRIIKQKDIDQKNYPGKIEQDTIYNI